MSNPDRVLIRGGWVVAVDPATASVQRADILVEAGRITAMGPDLPIDRADVIEAGRGIVIPGLVNAHLHTWQTALRGVAGDWTFAKYLRGMHQGLATRYTPEDIWLGTFVGALNQINNGTTTLADWCHNNPTPEHSDAAVDALQRAGIRAVFLHGSPKPSPQPGQPHFSEVPMPAAEVRRLRAGPLADGAALVTLGMAVLGPRDSIHPVTIADLALARELDLLASAHTGGTPFRNPEAMPKLAAAGLLGRKVNFVHANNISDRDLRILLDHGGSVTITADVEIAMAFGPPLTGRLRDLGASISIGSDVEPTVAGDLFGAMRSTLQVQRNADFAALLGAGQDVGDEPALSCADALRWATLGGAEMLGLEHEIGSLTVGKRADIVILAADALNLQPLHDPIAAVVMQAHAGNVETVLINGRVVKRGHRLTRGSFTRELDALAASGRRILAESGVAVPVMMA